MTEQTSVPSNLRLAEARDIVASGTSGKSLPVIEFMDAQQAEIERLTAALAACQTYDYRTLADEVERLRAALHGVRRNLLDGELPDRLAINQARAFVDMALRGEHETILKPGGKSNDTGYHRPNSDGKCSDCDEPLP